MEYELIGYLTHVLFGAKCDSPVLTRRTPTEYCTSAEFVRVILLPGTNHRALFIN